MPLAPQSETFSLLSEILSGLTFKHILKHFWSLVNKIQSIEALHVKLQLKWTKSVEMRAKTV